MSDHYVTSVIEAVFHAFPDEESVWGEIDHVFEEARPETELGVLGTITAAQYAYINRYAKVTPAQAKQGKRRDMDAAVKVAFIKSYGFKFYKEVIA